MEPAFQEGDSAKALDGEQYASSAGHQPITPEAARPQAIAGLAVVCISLEYSVYRSIRSTTLYYP